MVGAFPDGQSALMLAAAKSRHVPSTEWGKRRYMMATLRCRKTLALGLCRGSPLQWPFYENSNPPFNRGPRRPPDKVSTPTSSMLDTPMIWWC
jgi:hypothetical protein